MVEESRGVWKDEKGNNGMPKGRWAMKRKRHIEVKWWGNVWRRSTI